MKYLIYVVVTLSLLSSCINTKKYLKSRNEAVKWLNYPENQTPILVPRNFMYSDDSFIYAYDNYKPRENNPIPIFYKLNKDSLNINATSGFLFNGEINSFIDVVWNSKVGWIFHSKKLPNGIIQYYVSPIDFNKSIKKEIFKVKLEKNQALTHNEFLINSDSTLITYVSVIYDETQNQVYFNVICLDLISLSIIWSNNYQIPYSISNIIDASNFDIKVNQEGEPQFILKTYVDGTTESIRKNGKRVANYEYRFFSLNKEGKAERYKLETESKFIKSIEFTVQSSNLPIISAYTYDKFNFNKLSGLMVFEIDDKNKEIKKLNEIKFNKELIFTNIDETDIKIKQQEDFERTDKLKIVNLIKSNDSSIYVLGEVDFIKTVLLKMAGETQIKNYFVSGNILVTRINKYGNEDWTIVIPKSQKIHTKMIAQVVYDGKPNSFASFLIENKIHLFMNDNMKNYQTYYFDKVREWNGRNSCFVHTVIENDGKYNMNPILDADDHPLVIDIKSIKYIDDHHIFINDHKTIGKLKF